MRSDAQRCICCGTPQGVLSMLVSGWMLLRLYCRALLAGGQPAVHRRPDGRTEGGSGLLTSKTRRKSICEFILTGGSTGQHRAAQGRLKARPGRGRAEVGIGEMGR
jgi:hypothetical protein